MRSLEMQLAVAMRAVAAFGDAADMAATSTREFIRAVPQKVGKKRYTERRAKAKAAKASRKRNRGSK